VAPACELRQVGRLPGEQVARRVVAEGGPARVRMVHGELPPQRVIGIGRLPPVGVRHLQQLAERVVQVSHADVGVRNLCEPM